MSQIFPQGRFADISLVGKLWGLDNIFNQGQSVGCYGCTKLPFCTIKRQWTLEPDGLGSNPNLTTRYLYDLGQII